MVKGRRKAPCKTVARDYEKIAKATIRIRKNRVTDKVYPEFLKQLYWNLLVLKADKANKVFWINKKKYWTISESKMAERLHVSGSTARKLMNDAETKGYIERHHLFDTHRTYDAMGIALTEKGKKLLKEMFKPRKKSENNNSNPDYNYNYKSGDGTIHFKAFNDKITAKAIVTFQEVTGLTSERITPWKAKWIHQVINTLSKAFNELNSDNLISIFRNFLKQQLGYLKKITFHTLFYLKNVWACIWRMKNQVKQHEETYNSVSSYERIEAMIQAFKNKSPAEIVPPQLVSPAENVSEKLSENKSFSNNPNISINENISVKPRTPQSLGNLLSSFLDKMKVK